MNQPPRRHINRSDSISMPCSPPTHACRENPVFSGASSPVASRELPQQTVTGDNASQELEACAWDSASSPTSRTPSPFSSFSSSPPISEQEISYDIYNYIHEFMDPNGVDMSLCFEQASLQPPITTESLAELDIPRIINNPKLRHDVNFDRELHFRPNLDGSRGRQKMKSADHYWKALEGELFMYGFASVQRQQSNELESDAYWGRILKGSQRRLRKIFEAIRDILKTLVPDYEQKAIVERLDVDLIMQEISNGMCDLIALSNWLAKVLQAHCAPMRDELVEAMKMDIQNGALESCHEKLVNGLRQLLSILEFMKLDVANHQIRHMRPLLIEDTVNFQRRYNAHRIANNKIDVCGSRRWLANEREQMATPTYIPTHLEALSSALLKDLLFSDTQPVGPSTFYLDADRLRSMRTELHGRIYQQICLDVLNDLVPAWVNRSEVAKAQTALHVSVAALAGVNGRFSERMENIAVEIVRIVLMLEGRQPPYDSDLLGIVEQRLEQELFAFSSAFDNHARDLCDHLLPKLQASVEKNVRLSALALQDSLVPAAPTHNNIPIGFGAVCVPPTQTRQLDPDDDCLRRLTHVIVLQWHVWSELVYLTSPTDDEDSDFSDDLDRPYSTKPSDTKPLAEAHYGNRKFLPLSLTVKDVTIGIPTPAPSPAPGTEQDQENEEAHGHSSIDHHHS